MRRTLGILSVDDVQVGDHVKGLLARCDRGEMTYAQARALLVEELRAFQALGVRGAFVSHAEALAWWRSPHPELGGKKPCEVTLEEGGADCVAQQVIRQRAEFIRQTPQKQTGQAR